MRRVGLHLNKTRIKPELDPDLTQLPAERRSVPGQSPPSHWGAALSHETSGPAWSPGKMGQVCI